MPEDIFKTIVAVFCTAGIGGMVMFFAYVREDMQGRSITKTGDYVCLVIAALVAVLFFGVLCATCFARDVDGRYAARDPKLHEWFESLRSGYGQCCADADGMSIDDPNWKVVSDPSRPTVHYRVLLEGRWLDVQDAQVVTVPNLVGKAMLWPMRQDGGASIRCFMPGSMG
jgi:hypothetical protein